MKRRAVTTLTVTDTTTAAVAMQQFNKRHKKLVSLVETKHDIKDRVSKVDMKRRMWDDDAVFLTRRHVRDALENNDQKQGIVSLAMSMIVTNYRVTKTLMPYMVHNKTSTVSNGKALSNDLLFDLFSNATYTKLDNFVDIVSSNVDGYNPIQTMFPRCIQGSIRDRNLYIGDIKQIPVAILIACGPMLEVHLNSTGGSEQAEDLFALQTVTSDQQKQASHWLARRWEQINTNTKLGVVMPSVGTSKWWKFVSSFMGTYLGFGVVKQRQKGKSTTHQLVANSFWKKHEIDVVQLALSHRLCAQDVLKEDVPLTYNGRPYGVLKEALRKCCMCPPSRPETPCVRQNGTQWLCSSADLTLDVANKCHRNYHLAIDTGYLDVDVPNDERKDAMVIEEINDEEQERLEIDNKLAALLPEHRQLLTDLGFVPGVYEVTTSQMEEAWTNVVDVTYLKSLDLSHCANNSKKLKTVRRAATKSLDLYGLSISMQQKRSRGKMMCTYVLSRNS
jgi:hypothetical protein